MSGCVCCAGPGLLCWAGAAGAVGEARPAGSLGRSDSTRQHTRRADHRRGFRRPGNKVGCSHRCPVSRSVTRFRHTRVRGLAKKQQPRRSALSASDQPSQRQINLASRRGPRPISPPEGRLSRSARTSARQRSPHPPRRTPLARALAVQSLGANISLSPPSLTATSQAPDDASLRSVSRSGN